jgi:predicted Zn-dependent protease
VSTPKLENNVNTTIESFSKTTTSDLQSITMRKLKVIETKEGEDIQTLFARTKNVLQADLTAAINGINIDKIFGAGELIKIVVEVPYNK